MAVQLPPAPPPLPAAITRIPWIQFQRFYGKRPFKWCPQNSYLKDKNIRQFGRTMVQGQKMTNYGSDEILDLERSLS